MNFVNEGGLRGKGWKSHTWVAEELGKAIVSGEYPAGSMIPLDPDISEMFDVSRTVVREAKKTLSAKGFIQSKAKVGTHVRSKSDWNMFDADVLRWHAAKKDNSEFIAELFDIRLIFEPSAAATVAQIATDADCSLLNRACEELEASTFSKAGFAVADLEFHKTILRLTGNSFLMSMGDLVQASLYSVFAASTSEIDEHEMRTVIQEHKEIAAAVSAHDVDAARHVMTQIIIRGKTIFLRRLSEKSNGSSFQS